MNYNNSEKYLHPATGSYSSLDLSQCSQALLQCFNWMLEDDLCGSDHVPFFITSSELSTSLSVTL